MAWRGRLRRLVGTWVVLAVVVGLSAACGASDHSVQTGGSTPTTGATGATGATTILLTCGGDSSFPVSALDGPTGAEQGSDPLAVALRAAIALPQLVDQHLSDYDDWRLLFRTSARAGFLADGTDSSLGHMYVELGVRDGGWYYRDSSRCGLHVTEPGAATAEWALDPAFAKPAATDTSLHVVVNDPECNDGKLLDPKRIHPAQLTWTGTSVTVVFFVDPVSPGMHSCPGPIGAPGRPDVMGVPTVLELGRAIGARQILDASTYPPTPARTSAQP